ncbi:MAG: glycoside hydrolase family 25 protein [Ruminococcus sp.]|nr:glycoside hydrolase family 25 protein [Ruminococcus sp.]
MKKIIIIIVVFLLIGVGVGYFGYNFYKDYQIEHAVVIIDLKEDLSTEFLSDVKVSDFITNINGEIIDDYKIDTTKVGNKEIKFKYINEDNIKLERSYNIEVVDKVAPVIWLGGSYTVTKGSNINLTEKVMCGDNYDNEPICEIVGDYDMNVVGTYPLVFKATDSSGNITEKPFNLYVREPSGGGNNTSTPTRTYFKDVVANYKNENTEIGLDISSWQGEIDFQKIKDEGVEFLFIRVGSTRGIDGEYFLDNKFEKYIKGANEVGIPVGIYFYSYADSREKAIKDAHWILDQIEGKGYKIDLPIVFDWENWSFYNEFKLSFFGLTDMANAFLDVFKDKGYKGMLYSSKSYLESIWLKTDYPIWLAHYVDKTSYTGEYEYWQMCSDGRIDGINGDVDIDIRYK